MNERATPYNGAVPRSVDLSQGVFDKKAHASLVMMSPAWLWMHPLSRIKGSQKQEMHEGAKGCKIGTSRLWVNLAHALFNISDGEGFHHDVEGCCHITH